MTEYKGKNNIRSSQELAFQRARFRADNMVDDPEEKVLKDFTLYENHHYGRIDPFMNVVYSNQNLLKLIPSTNQNIAMKAHNFVVDAFEKVKSKFDMARTLGTIPRDQPYLSQLKVYRAYEDPVLLYNGYSDILFNSFNNLYLEGKKILNFDDYYKSFTNYIRTINVELPISFTAFQRSKNTSFFSSGLALSIADLEYDEDQPKMDFFINTSCYEFYKSVCLNNGFYISKNSPWVLVANILSPALLLYTRNYNLSTKKQIFLSHFNECRTIDINLLLNNLIKYYNIYYNNKSYYKEIDICNNKSKNNIIFKTPLNLTNTYKKYSEYNMLELYIEIRNIEEYSVYTKKQLREIIKKAKYFYKFLDKETSLGYINNTFRKAHKNRPGGLNSIVNSLSRRTNDISNS